MPSTVCGHARPLWTPPPTDRAARRFGALTITYAEATGLTTTDGKVDGALVADRLTGESLTLRARHVVNATGVWVDALQEHEEPGRTAVVQPSKGVHVVVPR